MLERCKICEVIKGMFSTEGLELRELRGSSQQVAYEPQRPGRAKKEARLDWCWTFALMAIRYQCARLLMLRMDYLLAISLALSLWKY